MNRLRRIRTVSVVFSALKSFCTISSNCTGFELERISRWKTMICLSDMLQQWRLQRPKREYEQLKEIRKLQKLLKCWRLLSQNNGKLKRFVRRLASTKSKSMVNHFACLKASSLELWKRWTWTARILRLRTTRFLDLFPSSYTHVAFFGLKQNFWAREEQNRIKNRSVEMRSFISWRTCARENFRKLRAASCFMARKLLRSMNQTWWEWNVRCAHQQQQVMASQKCRYKFRVQILKRVYLQWNRKLCFSRAFRKSEAQALLKSRQMLGLAWSIWVVISISFRGSTLLIDELANRRNRTLLNRAINFWKRNCALKKIIRRIRWKRCDRRPQMQRICMITWRTLVLQRRKDEQTFHIARTTIANGFMRRILIRWKRACSLTNILNFTGAKLLKSCCTSIPEWAVLSQSFTALYNHNLRLRLISRCVRRTFMWNSDRISSRIFKVWRQNAAIMARKKFTVSRCKGQGERRQCQRCWREWRTHHQIEDANKRLALLHCIRLYRVVHLVLGLELRILNKVWSAWNVARLNHIPEQVFEKVVDRNRLQILRTELANWKMLSATKQHFAWVEARCTLRRILQVLMLVTRIWRNISKKLLQDRNFERLRLVFERKRLLSSAFKLWQYLPLRGLRQYMLLPKHFTRASVKAKVFRAFRMLVRESSVHNMTASRFDLMRTRVHLARIFEQFKNDCCRSRLLINTIRKLETFPRFFLIVKLFRFWMIWRLQGAVRGCRASFIELLFNRTQNVSLNGTMLRWKSWPLLIHSAKTHALTAAVRIQKQAKFEHHMAWRQITSNHRRRNRQSTLFSLRWNRRRNMLIWAAWNLFVVVARAKSSSLRENDIGCRPSLDTRQAALVAVENKRKYSLFVALTAWRDSTANSRNSVETLLLVLAGQTSRRKVMRLSATNIRAATSRTTGMPGASFGSAFAPKVVDVGTSWCSTTSRESRALDA